MAIIEQIHKYAESRPDDLCVRLYSKRKPEGTLSWGQLLERSRHAAAFLKARGVSPGDVIALMGGHDLDFYPAWLGAVWLGAVPCVLPEPSVRVDRTVYWSRLEAMLEFGGIRYLMCGPSAGEIGTAWTGKIPQFNYADSVALPGETPEIFVAAPEHPYLLQHSAGTTGIPKSILLTHGMVREQLDALYERADHTVGEPETLVSWLPLYHDLGLICCFLAPLHDGVPVIWLSTFEWVSSPTLLLEAISETRATRAMCPNFAFAFLANATCPDGLDLSSLRTMYSGGEPVTESAMRAFMDRYARAGFPADAFHVGYGMAESIAVVASTGASCPPRFATIDRDAWTELHRAVPATDASAGRLTHVSCGLPLRGCELRVVDDAGDPVPARSAGRVLVRTPYLFSGYYRRDDLNHDLFDADGFYDSGDLGYLDDDGHVYITGRINDLVIVGGRNVYPQDIEDVANTIAGVHPGRVVCFGVDLARRGTQGLIVLFESDEAPERWPALKEAVQRAIVESLDVDLFDVRCVARTALRKSTAGKLARAGNRTWYLEGRFGELPPSVRP